MIAVVERKGGRGYTSGDPASRVREGGSGGND